jgi:hypothetical protein
MSVLKNKFFSRKKTWISDTYETTEEAFWVAEYFARYATKHEENGSASNGRNLRGCLYLEQIDVIFCPNKRLPRKILKLGYGSGTLKILLPNRGYTDEQKELLRDLYQQKYAPILKESHARTNVFLWHTFSEKERTEIVSAFKRNAKNQLNIKKAVLREILNGKTRMKTRKKSTNVKK